MNIIEPWDEHNQRLVANVRPSDWQNPTPAGMYNLVVVGGGSAGLVAAVGAAGLGAKVALVEKHLLGGDCLNVGCVPSKAVIRAARATGDIRAASEYGVQVEGRVTVDFAQVMARMRRIRAEISDHDSARRFTDLGIDVFLGGGVFRGPDTLEVDGATLRFRKALIATGSRASIPPVPGLAQSEYLTNETLFELTTLPERLAIIGGGPIGVEMAQAFQRLGSRVTVLQRNERIMMRDDPDASRLIAATLEQEGVKLVLNASLMTVCKQGRATQIEYGLENGAGKQKETLEVDAVLVAAGRMPNIETLNLDAAQVQVEQGAVVVNDLLQTTNSNIFAAGDVGFRYQFTHTADFTARLVVQNALFPFPKRKVSSLLVPWTTFTDPEVAHVGMTQADAEQASVAIQSYTQPIGETDRGRADGDTEGFVRVHVKQGSDKIVGATIVARHAGEMINELTLASQQGLGLKTLAGVIHPYPTQAEAIRKLGDTYNRARLSPLVKRVLGWWMARARG